MWRKERMYCTSRSISIYYIFFRMQGITPETGGLQNDNANTLKKKKKLLRPCYALRIFKNCLPKRRNTKDMLPEAARSNVLRRRMSEGRTG
jgi:hypothetical protein